MPDWTYQPLRDPAAGALGSYEASRRAAMRFIRRVARLPGGGWLIRGFDYTHDHPEVHVTVDGVSYASPIGVQVSVGGDATETVFRSMGYGFAATDEELPPGAALTTAATATELLSELDAGATMLIANEAVIAEGPALAQRVNEALAERSHRKNSPDPVKWFQPWTWDAWVWALWLGIAMVCAGIGAAIIALGPVTLPYDLDFLGVSLDEVREINPQLVPFLQHDRITMAGCMMAIGFNDIGFAFGIRRGWRWARAGFGVAGAVGFPTFFLFLGYRFFDPLHFAVAAGFFPLYLFGLFRRQTPPNWRAPLTIAEPIRLRALRAQLMMVMIGAGVFVSGLYIMSVGLREVLIPSDRVFLGESQEFFASALDGRLLRFIAHDRAGFGGALASLGAGLTTTGAWGWKAGERSTWIMLLLASVAGFGAALIVHWVVGYTDLLHLMPVYVGMVWMAAVLHFSKPWFFAQT